MLKLIYSIHDICPGTFPLIKSTIDILAQVGVRRLILLIIPLCGWEKSQLEELSILQQQGHILGAHGLRHRNVLKKSPYHFIHSRLFSRDTAEHLSMSKESGKKLLLESYQWFEKSNLNPAELYVPPAWSLGKIKRRDFKDTGFKWVETFCGIYDVANDLYRRIPLMGFEADTSFRAVFVRQFNKINLFLSNILNRPLRIAIHPYDHKLLLSKDLQDILKMSKEKAEFIHDLTRIFR